MKSRYRRILDVSPPRDGALEPERLERPFLEMEAVCEERDFVRGIDRLLRGSPEPHAPAGPLPGAVTVGKRQHACPLDQKMAGSS